MYHLPPFTKKDPVLYNLPNQSLKLPDQFGHKVEDAYTVGSLRCTWHLPWREQKGLALQALHSTNSGSLVKDSRASGLFFVSFCPVISAPIFPTSGNLTMAPADQLIWYIVCTHFEEKRPVPVALDTLGTGMGKDKVKMTVESGITKPGGCLSDYRQNATCDVGK